MTIPSSDHMTISSPYTEDHMTIPSPYTGDHMTIPSPYTGDHMTIPSPYTGDHMTIPSLLLLGHTKFVAGPRRYDEEFDWNCAVPWPALAISQKLT